MTENKVDKFLNNIKNNRYLAPIIVIGMIILALIAFIQPLKNFIVDLMPKNYSNQVDISILNYDPVFTFEGSKMNWGGGSQALFVNCGNRKCNLANERALINYEVWETLGFNPIEFRVNAVYNAPSNAPNCLIEEWGIHLTKSKQTLENGIFLNYNNVGGADAPIEGGECLITDTEGEFPITIWYDQDNKTNGNSFLKYLKPNDVIAMKISANAIKDFRGSINPTGISNSDLVEVRVYARTRIEKEIRTILSTDYIKLVIPEQRDSVDWQLNKFSWEEIEKNRNRTIEK